MRKKIFYRVFPVFSLIFAMFFSVPSFADSAPSGISVYADEVSPVFGEVSYTDLETAYTSMTFTTSYSVSLPVGVYNRYLTFKPALTIYPGNATGLFCRGIVRNVSVYGGGGYVSSTWSGGSISDVLYDDPVSVSPTVYLYFTNLVVPSQTYITVTLEYVYLCRGGAGAYMTIQQPTSLNTSSISYNVLSDNPDPVVSGLDSINNSIIEQGDNLVSGYDNSSLTGSNSDLSGGLTQYENQENEMLGQVDFTSVAMTDVFSLSDFVSSTSLFGTFMQGIFTNLGTANAIIIISLSLMFALAALGYRKYLRG